jgi:hypothetical protein
MKRSRSTIRIVLPIILLSLLASIIAGCACYPPGTMPPKCQEWFDKGRMEGYEIGRQTGIQEGKAMGFQEGYNQGLEDGKKLAPACPTCPECPKQPTYYPYNSPYYFPYRYPYYQWWR